MRNRSSLAIIGTLALALAVSILTSTAGADTVVLNPVKDNTLYQNTNGSLSNGNGSSLFVGRTGQGSNTIRRACLQFDFAGNIPAGATIDSISLAINVTRTANSGGRVAGLHELLVDWGEGTSVAGSGEGGGAPSTTGDATWIHTFFSTTQWTTPGGDFNPTPATSTTITGGGGATFASTPQFVAEAQKYLDIPSMNFGWIMIGDESASRTAKRFGSRESGGNTPRLTVNYTAGTPPDTVTCRASRVNNGAGAATNVLSINGSFGDSLGVVTVAPGAPITVAMAASPSGPVPGPFVVYLDLGEPTPGSVTMLPRSLGLFCVRTPINGGMPFKTWNNIGRQGRLGVPDFPSTPAPSILVAAPTGTNQMATATLQGILLDNGSSAANPASITNAVILKVQ